MAYPSPAQKGFPRRDWMTSNWSRLSGMTLPIVFIMLGVKLRPAGWHQPFAAPVMAVATRHTNVRPVARLGRAAAHGWLLPGPRRRGGRLGARRPVAGTQGLSDL